MVTMMEEVEKSSTSPALITQNGTMELLFFVQLN